jgi:hypothetical protein
LVTPSTGRPVAGLRQLASLGKLIQGALDHHDDPVTILDLLQPAEPVQVPTLWLIPTQRSRPGDRPRP